MGMVNLIHCIKYLSRSIYSVVDCFPETSSWCWKEQIWQGVECMVCQGVECMVSQGEECKVWQGVECKAL